MRTKNWPDTVHAKKKNKAQLKFERFKKHEVFHISHKLAIIILGNIKEYWFIRSKLPGRSENRDHW
jgi:hypothetical protein